MGQDLSGMRAGPTVTSALIRLFPAPKPRSLVWLLLTGFHCAICSEAVCITYANAISHIILKRKLTRIYIKYTAFENAPNLPRSIDHIRPPIRLVASSINMSSIPSLHSKLAAPNADIPAPIITTLYRLLLCRAFASFAIFGFENVNTTTIASEIYYCIN